MRGHNDLVNRCRARAREGLWLLYRELVTGERDSVLDVLQLIDPERLATFKDLADG